MYLLQLQTFAKRSANWSKESLDPYCRTKLRSVAKPNPVMIAPEILFTHFSLGGSNLSLNTSTLLHKMINQEAEPIKMPETKDPADT